MTALQLSTLFCFMTTFQIGFLDKRVPTGLYIESTQSYYKLYKYHTPRTDAKAKCQSEGAVMFHPDNKEELLQVFSALDVKKGVIEWINTGSSNLASEEVFETMDGRPISQVYNIWRSGEPRSCRKVDCHCVFLNVEYHVMVADPCSIHWPFICKLSKETVANASLRISDLKQQVRNQSAALVVLEELTANQTGELKALEQLTENQTRELKALEQLTENQTGELKALEQLTENQTGELKALEQLTENQTGELKALEQLTENQTGELKALEQLTTNQTSELEALKQRVDSMQQHHVNHFSVFERLMEAVVNQTTALERTAKADASQAATIRMQTEAMKQLIVNETATLKQITEAKAHQSDSKRLQTEAIEVKIASLPSVYLTEAVTKQASALDRLVLIMEKFVNLQSNNDQLSVRSEQ